MTQQARGNCAAAVSIPLACSTVIIPSALVNEKCVSAFEFSRIKPNPSSRSGGSTIGKTPVHGTDPPALERTNGGQDPYPAQPPVGAGREVKARRIGTVDNIDVVVARRYQHALGELRMAS